eukprot:gnl/Dysnectes_brevis/570_a629_3567.p1 GENE.gnl/Dysnectes_brevis/570_a629_3567~~gnl/Dysnectes_brevis/570_a629_3567.p1  ORF type:complete len:298 (-),score=72.41 gnl/Dysnectes_brevis/570_a629_3567:60-953(-)
MGKIKSVRVHPTVLLSVADHHQRIVGSSSKRVVGILVGSVRGSILHVSNSYAVPFDEKKKSSDVFFFDTIFHERMYALQRRISSTEYIVGWYSTAPKLCPADTQIHQLINESIVRVSTTPYPPTLILIDVTESTHAPTKAYTVAEHDEATGTPEFQFLSSRVEATEVEAIAVEQLTRRTGAHAHEHAAGGLQGKLRHRAAGMEQLELHVGVLQRYVQECADEERPPNAEILRLLQETVNFLSPPAELASALVARTNDTAVAGFVAELVRCVVSLDELIENKTSLRKKETEPLSADSK